MVAFRLFIILPSEELCSLRDVTSGVSARDIQCRLELEAGLPAGVYGLRSTQGQTIGDNHVFVLGRNVWDGFLLRVQLDDHWQTVYRCICAGDVDSLLKAVKWLPQQDVSIAKDDEEEDKTGQSTQINDQKSMALYMASWLGTIKLCHGLLAAGLDPNGCTQFHRTAIFAAVARDNAQVVEILLSYGALLTLSDCSGMTPVTVARVKRSRQSTKVMRDYDLAKRNLALSFGKPTRSFSSSSFPRARSEETLSINLSYDPGTARNHITNGSKNRPQTVRFQSQGVRHKTNKSGTMKDGGQLDIPRSLTHGFVQPRQMNIDTHQPLLITHGPSSISSASPRGSTAGGSERCANTPRTSSWVRFRLESNDGNTSRDRKFWKSGSVVQWDGSLKDTYTFSAGSSKPNRTHINGQQTGNNPSLDATRNVMDLNGTNIDGELSRRPQTTTGVRHVIDVNSSSQAVNGGSIKGMNNEDAERHDAKPGVETQENETPPHVNGFPCHNQTRQYRSSNAHRYFIKSRHKSAESVKAANRRIQLAEHQKRATTANGTQGQISFEQWLKKKNSQEEDDSDLDSDESSDDSDDEERNAIAFQNWLNEIKNRPKYQNNPKSAASLHKRKTRAIHGLVWISPLVERPPMAVPDTSSYMHAMKDWHAQRKMNRGDIDAKGMDALEAKRKLEEKNQQLLATAITFHEWMAYSEDRDKLVQIIQRAGKNKPKLNGESKKLVKGITFQQWRDSLDKRESMQKSSPRQHVPEVKPRHPKKEVHFSEPFISSQNDFD